MTPITYVHTYYMMTYIPTYAALYVRTFTDIHHFPTCYAYREFELNLELLDMHDIFSFFFCSTGTDSCFWEFHGHPSSVIMTPGIFVFFASLHLCIFMYINFGPYIALQTIVLLHVYICIYMYDLPTLTFPSLSLIHTLYVLIEINKLHILHIKYIPTKQ